MMKQQSDRRGAAAGVEADLGFAHLDLDRQRRRGVPEVVYGPGKSPEQIAAILERLNAAGQNGCATRVPPEVAEPLLAALPGAVYHAVARVVTRDIKPLPRRRGRVAVVCAGTTDIPVAEEAALTAERLGSRIDRLFEPFFTTKPSGLGLGLSISRTIIEAHHGRIWAQNDPAGGATFRFALPVPVEET